MNPDNTPSPTLDPLPSRPWETDVRIWRSTSACGASIPWTVTWHSPAGWDFGYHGSGAADLALNILNAFVPPNSPPVDEIDTGEDWLEGDDDPVRCYRGVSSSFAARWHQEFKQDFIASLTGTAATLDAHSIHQWINARRRDAHSGT